MKINVFLVEYSVKGVKTIDQTVSLSFYKKTISKPTDTREYNIKGIYGMNGSGKSGIITSVGILRNLLMNAGYLNNPIVQKNLDAIINKKTNELYIEAEFFIESEENLMLFGYEVTLSKDASGKYMISYERLVSKKTSGKKDISEIIFKVVNGELVTVSKKWDRGFSQIMEQKTTNLLSNATFCALFYEKILMPSHDTIFLDGSFLFVGLYTLLYFGTNIYVYLDQADEHSDYLIENTLGYSADLGKVSSEMDVETISLLAGFLKTSSSFNVVSVAENIVPKSRYRLYKKMVAGLRDFLRIFKPDLQDIEIDKKEDHDDYICSLVMVYDSYKVNVEFESTGIKKLVKLYAYLKGMVRGGIVFIDEFDSNLHDVYLCALLEYLMEYGEGQLCFTTHNVGPMDVLKRNKKSIDFLSLDHKIYPWKTNGNYSPSRLYRNGMIEGSPFNVDSIDFIGGFDTDEGDE